MNIPSQPKPHPTGKECIFTICTKSYIGLAEALGTSMRKNGVTADFLIVVVDHDVSDVAGVTGDIVSAQTFCGYSDESWASRTFKYDLVELCTSIKARVFQSVFNLGYEKAIYFDPDIVVFDDLKHIFDSLETHDVVATPHRMSLESDVPARGGVFNLGFLAARNSGPTSNVMKWWDQRLEHRAINDPLRGFFTDQKWMDHLPVLLRTNQLLISNHSGMNLAPWNLNERELREVNGNWEARLKDDGSDWQALSFVHFSAFNYRDLASGTANVDEDPANEEMPGFGALLGVLSEYLRLGGFLTYASIPYEYGEFSDGSPVLPGHRRIYLRLIESEVALFDPFKKDGKLYKSLKRARLLAPVGSGQAKRLDANARSQKSARVAKVFDVLARFSIMVLGYGRYSLLNKFFIRYCHQVNHARLLRDLGRDIEIEYF